MDTSELEARLTRAYAERNALAVAFAKAALAAGWKAGRGFDDDPKKDRTPKWRHVLYVDLPTGEQVSWHMSPTEVHLLDGLPEYSGRWDGTFIARNPDWVGLISGAPGRRCPLLLSVSPTP